VLFTVERVVTESESDIVILKRKHPELLCNQGGFLSKLSTKFLEKVEFPHQEVEHLFDPADNFLFSPQIFRDFSS